MAYCVETDVLGFCGNFIACAVRCEYFETKTIFVVIISFFFKFHCLGVDYDLQLLCTFSKALGVNLI